MTVLDQSQELHRPEELNGTLFTLLLPLVGPDLSLVAGAKQAWFDSSEDPFLYARADTVAPQEARVWTAGGAGRYWAWPQAVRLAHKRHDLERRVVFGRSTSTVAEFSERDQPLDVTEARSASLWHADGAGFVLALEWLSPDHQVAEMTDKLGKLLTESPVQDYRGNSERSIDILIRKLSDDLGTSLSTIFDDQIADLEGLDSGFVRARLGDLVVFRRTAILGERLVEGLLTGVSASVRELGIQGLLQRGDIEDSDFEENCERQREFTWTYRPVTVAEEVAKRGAVSAMRSDARVAVLDLDAFSIYHDYLGAGGDTTVVELVPLAAVLGRKARDFWDVSDRIAQLAGQGSSKQESVSRLREDLRSARTVRARNELRRLMAAELYNDSNFTAWTEPTHLRRQLASTAMADVLEGSTARVDGLSESVEVLEHLLALRQQEAANRSRSLLQAVLGVFTGAGLLGLFAAIASVPGKDREIQSLVEAGLWTLLATTVLGILIAGGWSLLQKPPAQGSSRVPSALVVVGTAAALVISGIGLLADGAASVVLLLCGLVVQLVTVGLALKRLPPIA